MLVRIGLIGIVIFVAGFLAIQWLTALENPKSYFATYAEAKASGIMEKGWLPEYLPRSATEINETHNIDTNEVKASFKYQLGDTEEIRKNCKKLEGNSAQSKWECGKPDDRIIITLGASGSATLHSYP